MAEEELDELDKALQRVQDEERHSSELTRTESKDDLNCELHTNESSDAQNLCNATNAGNSNDETANKDGIERSHNYSDDNSDFSESESDSNSDSESDSQSESGEDLCEDSEDEHVDTEIPRTTNEITAIEIPQIPQSLEINESTPVELVGTIHTVGDLAVVIKSKSNASYRVLADGAVLVLGGPDESKTPIGVLYETFGPVENPFFVVKFSDAAQMSQFSNCRDMPVYQVIGTSRYVRTDELKVKGSDASNFNDEEVPLEEQEFSDDEQEQLAKMKSKKRKRIRKRGEGGKNKSQHAQEYEGKQAQSMPKFPTASNFPMSGQSLVPTLSGMEMPVPPMFIPPMNMTPEMAQRWYQFQQYEMGMMQNQCFNTYQHSNHQWQNQHPPPPPY